VCQTNCWVAGSLTESVSWNSFMNGWKPTILCLWEVVKQGRRSRQKMGGGLEAVRLNRMVGVWGTYFGFRAGLRYWYVRSILRAWRVWRLWGGTRLNNG
jgi:hypothetical protein